MFCIVPIEKIGLAELPRLEHNKHLHNEFTRAYRQGEYRVCQELYEHIKDNFSGELKTFYDEILERISKSSTR